MKIVTNRPCIIGDRVFAEGDVVDNHDYAEKLLAFGYAVEADETPASDTASRGGRPTKPESGTNEEEQA